MKVTRVFRSRLIDIAIIIAVVIVPYYISAHFMSAARNAATEAMRESMFGYNFLALLVFNGALVVFTVTRFLIGIIRKWPSNGMRIVSFAITPFLAFFGGIFIFMITFATFYGRPNLLKIRDEVDHKAIAQACAHVMAQWELYAEKNWDDPLFPAVLRDIKPVYISVSEKSINIEMQGGFNHYGVFFAPVTSNKWGLTYYTEHSKKLLA